MYVGQTTKSRDSEYTSISARYSEKCLKILKITKDSENSEHCWKFWADSEHYWKFW
jgi:hypothetical protein